MARLDITQVEGFDALNQKLKTLDDRIKRREVLALQRRLARPVQKAYAANLPKKTGTLSKSVAIKSVTARKSNGNPVVQVVPGKRGKNDGYYKFMVIRKGDRPGSTQRGSRKTLNTVTGDARDRTLSQIGDRVAIESEKKMAEFVQKRIDRLSR